jgi:antitoxin (DNA-binding transcriptional repressor) of toxin-antitoxin stability system
MIDGKRVISIDMKRVTVSATDLRVRLGEMLRRLEDEELVVEKGGIPVAILSRYHPPETDSRSLRRPANEEYERALVKRADPGDWETTMNTIRGGWTGVDAEEMIRNIYRSRDDNARLARHYDLDESDAPSEVRDDAWSTAPARLRHLHRPVADAKRVADGGDATYDAGPTGDHPDHLR